MSNKKLHFPDVQKRILQRIKQSCDEWGRVKWLEIQVLKWRNQKFKMSSASKKQGTRVFKKGSPNGKITVYLGKRDFVDHVTHVDPIDGVVLVDPEYLKDRKVYGHVLAAFRLELNEISRKFSQYLEKAHTPIQTRFFFLSNVFFTHLSLLALSLN